MKRELICKGTVMHWLTAIEDEDPVTHRVKCRCKCGNIITPEVSSIMRGKTKSCGCYQREQHTKYHIVPGQKFEHCVAIKEIPKGNLHCYWLCRCLECGNEFIAKSIRFNSYGRRTSLNSRSNESDSE